MGSVLGLGFWKKLRTSPLGKDPPPDGPLFEHPSRPSATAHIHHYTLSIYILIDHRCNTVVPLLALPCP